MYNEGLMISCMINTMEGQYVATDYIPGAFLQTDYDKGYIHINMEGRMLTLLREIDPAYNKYSIYIYSHGKKSCTHNPIRLYMEL